MKLPEETEKNKTKHNNKFNISSQTEFEPSHVKNKALSRSTKQKNTYTKPKFIYLCVTSLFRVAISILLAAHVRQDIGDTTVENLQFLNTTQLLL
jgi:hypothetical protein